jgi:hypothetical protein
MSPVLIGTPHCSSHTRHPWTSHCRRFQGNNIKNPGFTKLIRTILALACSEDEAEIVRGLYLLTMKPMIYAANVEEGDLADKGASNAYVRALREKAAKEDCDVVIISAQVQTFRGGVLLNGRQGTPLLVVPLNGN